MIKDKVILILGGTGGIGSVIADLLTKEGAQVFRQGRQGEYAADATRDGEIKKLVERVAQQFGRLDAVVNSISAPAKIAPLDKKTWEDFMRQFNIQLKAAVEVALAAIPLMKKQNGGRIINVLTEYIIGEPPASLADYITAKYALWGLTKAMAKELGKYHIMVNAVSPSIIKNEFTGNVPEKLFELEAQRSASGRLTTAEDVAKAVVFLMSDEAGEINGENIVIAGGRILK